MDDIPKSIPIPNTSISIPRPGFGVYLLNRESCQNACGAALNSSYRHIDSARLYRNEAEVFAAVNSHPTVQREEVFLATKISKPQGSASKTYEQMISCVEKLGGIGGYVDLFLIHIPSKERPAREELWLSLERLWKEGRAKAIGVSNYRVNNLTEMKEYATVWPPHVNQIEVRLAPFPS